MNKQEIYLKMREHFSKPNVKFGVIARDTVTEDCVYRGNSDPTSPIRCIFGCILPDDKYDPGMEGKFADQVIDQYGLKDMFPSDTWEFIADMQALHDELARSINRNQIDIDVARHDLIYELDRRAEKEGLAVAI